MSANAVHTPIGLLISGGLDSAILLGHLLEEGRRVQPFYIDCGLVWQAAERRALEQFLRAMAGPWLAPLVTLELPLGDLYARHWSVTGRDVPLAGSTDEAVYLPGRNALLVVKAGLWCQMHDVAELALATLGSNPFSDATAEFFRDLESTLNRSAGAPLRVVRPFGQLDKRQVMELGRRYPLQWTFSCIAPVDGLHCGRCNKCAERQAAFRLIEMADPTVYLARHQPQSHDL